MCCVVLRTVAEFRRWLDTRGEGGPSPGHPGPILEDRRMLLDRYEQHVKHCTACKKVICSPVQSPCVCHQGLACIRRQREEQCKAP